MIWYICFAIVLALLGVIIYFAFDKRVSRVRMFYILLVCLCMAYVIYIPPFFLSYNFISASCACFINVLQLITIDADYLAFYDLIFEKLGSGIFADVYIAALGLIHIILPAVSALTAVTLIAQYITKLRVNGVKRGNKTLHVFSQIKEESIIFARDIRKNDKKCEIIFLDDKDKSEYSDLRHELRCKILDEKIENIRANAKKRKVYYYCISKDEEKNLNSTLAIMAQLESAKRSVQQNNYIYLFSSDPSAELIIDSLNKGSINIDIIDEHKIAAYNLISEYPLLEYATDNKISVLICGWSDVGQEVLKAASWCGMLPGYELSISVIARNVSDAANDFIASHPGLFTEKHNIKFFSYANDVEFYNLIDNELSCSNYIVVAESDDDSQKTVERAIALRRCFYKLTEAFNNAPPVFAYIETPEKALAVKSLHTAESNVKRRMPYNIIPFGMADKIYTFDNITESDLDILSRNVHLVYEDIFSDEPIDVASALERYNLFEVNKNANRANALHIRYKLLMLGLDYAPESNEEELLLSDHMSQEALERLTVSEHDRWMAFLESEGWTGATVEQAKAYQNSGVSRGRHNCPLLKMHPYICLFDELKERSAALGLEDSTVYDIELINRIPDILHDKWKVSGKYFSIVKKDNKSEEK